MAGDQRGGLLPAPPPLPARWVDMRPVLAIGGINAPVLFSGLTPGFVGLYQVNAQVPSGVTPGSAVPLIIKQGSATSNTVTVAIK